MDISVKLKQQIIKDRTAHRQSIVAGDRAIAVPAEFLEEVINFEYMFIAGNRLMGFDPRNTNARALIRRVKRDTSEYFNCHALHIGAMGSTVYFLLRFRTPADLLLFKLKYHDIMKNLEF